MNEISFDFINLKNEKTKLEVEDFLNHFDLKYTKVDCTIVARVKNKIIGVCSKLNNLIKNVAVADEYKGMNLLNSLLTLIIKKINEQNFKNVFVITKFINKKIFLEMNFKLIYENENISFLTTDDSEFKKYKLYIESFNLKGTIGVIIMNANPMTKGHLSLIETASLQNDHVIIIPVKEEGSLFTYKERVNIIQKNIVQFNNVILIEGTEFLVSKNFFPSYFIKSDEQTIIEQCKLDVNIFCSLFSKFLNQVTRYVGEEPYSQTTKNYNEVIKEILNQKDIGIKIIKRSEFNGQAISASKVRELIYKQDFESLKNYVTKLTYEFITSKEIIIRAKENPDMVFKKH
ncbi:adenylyltransferase/cytidyltransferase family protein [Spiroplasma culicicola]|uniref:[citrate (Pro-3S)-lyase] ligase n=1 Tax=Spiroplasma culicicola AES-1 TaxID=1276246 RepID=W6A5V1_9MOLU|nr:adenylyltransferase/cytidyltransferase family protein [Spiroplasma culicicola]AHI52513.1 [citrate (pro-3S)-lyase] ligase [Spiroplasma culicicola AES-1]